ncbi:MAG TPA: metallophosphoesterase [Edaphocola sp.]|nr:metallophosphoesterase [Edaphocola sp.]
MKRDWSFFAIVLAVAIFIEYLCFVAFTTATQSLNKPLRRSLLIGYIIIMVLGWIGFLSLRYISQHEFPKNVKAIIIACLFGWFVGRLLIGIIMIIGELFRGGQWLSQNLFPKSPSISSEIVEAGRNGISRSTFLSRTSLLIGALFFGGFLYGVTNRYRYQLKKVKVKIKDLPQALKGLKMVHLSDIHSGSFDNKEAVLGGIKLAMAQNPDLVVFTGDLVNDKATEVEPYIELFNQLKAPLGVYSILGNHDYGDYVKWDSQLDKVENLMLLKEHQKAMGWRLLMNENVILEKNGVEFALLGVENWSANTRFPRHGRMDLAYEGLEGRADIPLKILLSHDPSHWDAEVRPKYADIDLTLSGHTHGMQFGIELPFFKWSPIQYMYKQWAGLYQKEQQHLYVNRGYGFLGYQGRLGVLPEVTVIEFE